MLTGPWHLVMRLDPVFFPALSSGMGQLLQQLQAMHRLLRKCHKPGKTSLVRPGTEKQMEQVSARLFSGPDILTISHGLQGTSLYSVPSWNW